MPHCIALLATPKNGNNYYLLFEQPSSRRFHATSCVSSSLCSSSQNFCSSSKSTSCNSHQLRRSAFLHLASHPKILAQVFIPEFDFWVGIALQQLAHLTKGASTKPRVLYCSPKQNRLATLLALLLVAVRGPLLMTSALLPGQLLTRLLLEISSLADT